MACELLVCAFNKDTHVVGDVIDIKDVPCEWGSKECPPNWLIVRISDASASELRESLYENRRSGTGLEAVIIGRKRGIESGYVGIAIGGGKPTITKAQLNTILALRG